MITEDLKFFTEISNRVNNAIDKACQKYGVDRSYYNFFLKVHMLGDMFDKLGESILLDDCDSFCAFCGKKTYYKQFDEKGHFSNYICPKCLGEYEAAKETANTKTI